MVTSFLLSRCSHNVYIHYKHTRLWLNDLETNTQAAVVASQWCFFFCASVEFSLKLDIDHLRQSWVYTILNLEVLFHSHVAKTLTMIFYILITSFLCKFYSRLHWNSLLLVKCMRFWRKCQYFYGLDINFQ